MQQLISKSYEATYVVHYLYYDEKNIYLYQCGEVRAVTCDLPSSSYPQRRSKHQVKDMSLYSKRQLSCNANCVFNFIPGLTFNLLDLT